MTGDDAISMLVGQFVQVVQLQRELYILAGSMRTKISTGEVPNHGQLAIRLANYFEQQAANLEPFVKNLENCPRPESDIPTVSTFVVDPKAN